MPSGKLTSSIGKKRWPPRKAKRWTEARADPEVEKQVENLFDRLFKLQPEQDEEDRTRPKIVRMSPEAKSIWKQFYNKHAKEQSELEGDLAAAWSKHEAHAARIALIFHLVDCVMEIEGVQEDEIDQKSMVNAITLIEWFKYETRRIYLMLGESEGEDISRRLIELIERKGGAATAREVTRSSNLFDTSNDAEAAMNKLAKQGLANWENKGIGNKGGRPSRQLILATDITAKSQNLGK